MWSPVRMLSKGMLTSYLHVHLDRRERRSMRWEGVSSACVFHVQNSDVYA